MTTVRYLDYDVVERHEWSLDDEDLFERAREAELPDTEYGSITVEDETIFEATQRAGLDWPVACGVGACTSCAAVVTQGEVTMDDQDVLTDEEVSDGIRLTCIGRPETEEVELVFNAKRLPSLQDRAAD